MQRLAVGGGVAANGVLAAPAELDVRCTSRAVLCTDNAAMIASAARYGPRLPYPDYLALDAYATGEGPGRWEGEPIPGWRGPQDGRDHRVLQARLPPLCGGIEMLLRLRAELGFELEGGRHHDRRRSSIVPTSSGFRWSSVDGEELWEFFVEEALVRERLESRR